SILSNPETENDKHPSQVVEDQARVNSGQSGTQIPATTANLGPNTALTSAASSVQSNIGASQVSRAMPGKGKGSSRRGELLDGANKAFKIAEGLSRALPVVGRYVGAVAKVGLTVVEMVQVSGSVILSPSAAHHDVKAMDDNDERAGRLGTHVCRLSNVLEKLSNQSRQPGSSQTTTEMESLQQALKDVQHEIAAQQSQLGIKKFWNSSDHSGSLKKLQEKVRAALEEIQLLVNVKTSILVEEL
ncbi:hypothetical protein FRC00_006115, partial [Tulasnella sp. 408]